MENELFEKYLKDAVKKVSNNGCVIVDDQLYEDETETDHVDDSDQASDTVTIEREALIKLLVIAAKLGEVDKLNKIAGVLDSFSDDHVIVIDDLEDLEDHDEDDDSDDQEDEEIDEAKVLEDLVADESIE